MKKITNFLKALKNKFLRASIVLKVIIVVIIIVAGYFLYSKFFAKKNAQSQYQTDSVVRESIISSITESGNVTSTSLTNISSPTNGVIQETYVKNGDQVVQGQNLFKVKSTATPQEQASSYASFLGAQNSLNSAKANMNSLQSTLFKANQAFINDRGIVNPSDEQKTDPKYIEENADWLQAQSNYNNQAGVIAQAQASFNNASLSYAATQDSIVTAPISGTVTNFSSSIGSNVTASGTSSNSSSTSGSNSNSSSSSSTTPVLLLGNFSNLAIEAQVNEIDITSVKVGQKATITLDAFPDLTYVGKVDNIDAIGTNTSGVVTFSVYISFVSPPITIHPGMTATAVMQLERHDDVLAVPSSAVLTSSTGSTVRVLKNGKVTTVPVETGLSSDTDTEITSGLTEGQTVVTSVVTPVTSVTSTGSSPFSGLTGGRGGFGGAVRTGGGGTSGSRATSGRGR